MLIFSLLGVISYIKQIYLQKKYKLVLHKYPFDFNMHCMRNLLYIIVTYFQSKTLYNNLFFVSSFMDLLKDVPFCFNHTNIILFIVNDNLYHRLEETKHLSVSVEITYQWQLYIFFLNIYSQRKENQVIKSKHVPVQYSSLFQHYLFLLYFIL